MTIRMNGTLVLDRKFEDLSVKDCEAVLHGLLPWAKAVTVIGLMNPQSEVEVVDDEGATMTVMYPVGPAEVHFEALSVEVEE